MEPTIDRGSIVIGISYLGKLDRGDVIIFNKSKAGSRSQKYIKRIVGVPGDTLIIKQNKMIFYNGGEYRYVYFNGTVGDSAGNKYINERVVKNDISRLSIDGFFVVSDNYEGGGIGSAEIGLVSRSQMATRVIWSW